jgi:uncharacterized membrane protein YedE/YeeE
LTLEELSPHIVASIAGLVIGIALGAVVQRTNFCAMGAVSDLVVFRNWNRLRAWFLAMAVAILGTQLLAWAEMIDLGESIYLGSRLTWAAAILGGLLFGIGMVFAGGCGNRNLVRFGAGDLRSLVVVLVMGLSAGMTLYGLVAYLRVGFNDATAIELADHGLASQGLPDLVAAVLGATPENVRLVLALAVAIAIAAFCFSSAAFRQSPRNILGGLLVGALVVAGWWATGVLAFDEFEPVSLGSLTFIAPVGDGVLYLMTFTGSSISFGIALVGGVIAGAFLAAKATGSFHLQGFANKSDLERNLIGALLMGFGGVMALGCTIGQGVTGLSTLALGSFLALAAIIAGGVAGMRLMEALEG